jgi:hypothetical protein
VGVQLTATGAVNNLRAGRRGINGRWLYAGDGNNTLKVIDLDAPTASAIRQTISTGRKTRLDAAGAQSRSGRKSTTYRM